MRRALIRAAVVSAFCLFAAGCSIPSSESPGADRFAACPPVERQPYELTADQLLETVNSIAGIYLNPQEIFAVSCVYAPDAVVDVGDNAASLAADWAGTLRSGEFAGFEALRYPSAGMIEQSETSAEAVLFVRSDPFRATGANLEWIDGNWLIVEWDYEPDCSSVVAATADPTMSDFWVEHATASCS